MRLHPVVRTRLCEALGSESAVDRVLPVLARLAPAFASFYVECRLSAGEDRLDVLAGTDERTRLRSALRQGLAQERSDFEAPWAAVERLVCAWCTDETLAKAPCLWLEFDEPDGFSPSCAACIAPGYPRPSGHTAENRHLAERVLVGLQHRETSEQAEELFACFAALPPGGKVIHVSPMLSRSGAPLKAYGSVPAEALSGFLEQLRWGGSHRAVTTLLEEFWARCTTAPDVFFDVAVRTAETETLGIVFSPMELREAQGDPSRRSLLERLVARNLCSAPRATALARWAGRERVSDERGCPQVMDRWLDIKLVADGDALHAKAYLGFRIYEPVF